jgi:hypothetical protein
MDLIEPIRQENGHGSQQDVAEVEDDRLEQVVPEIEERLFYGESIIVPTLHDSWRGRKGFESGGSGEGSHLSIETATSSGRCASEC